MPFKNAVHTYDLRGDHLKKVFERAVNDVSTASKAFPKFDVQVSGWFRTRMWNIPSVSVE